MSRRCLLTRVLEVPLVFDYLQARWDADHVAGNSYCYCNCHSDDCFDVEVHIDAFAEDSFQTDLVHRTRALALFHVSDDGLIGVEKLTLSWWLLRVHRRNILRGWAHARVHSIHRLLMTLLRALIHHHWSTSSWAWVAIGWHGRRAIVRGHERTLSSLLVHHLGPGCHALGSQERTSWVWHHNRRTHLSLLRHELVTLRERAKLWLHWWCICVRHHLRREGG